MKICVFGAGAVGGQLAARLAAAGRHEISVIARGAQLRAVRERGLTVRSGETEVTGQPSSATDDPATLPAQDLVLVTLKATALPASVDALAGLLGTRGTAVFLVNGIPWWWRYGTRDPGPLPLLDPDERLWKTLTPQRALGCVIYSPCEVIEPGVILHKGANRFMLGEPDGSESARLEAAAQALRGAGLDTPTTTDIRREVWLKLVRNASANTLAALTRLSLHDIAQDPALRRMAVHLIEETLAVAASLGWDVKAEVDAEQIVGRREGSLGPRPSMLQDVLLGRRLEVEALIGQTRAFAQQTGVAVPVIEAVLPLLRGLDRALANPSRPL